MKNLLYAAMTILLFDSCLTMENTFNKLPPGMWRASLLLDGDMVPSGDEDIVENRAFEEVTAGVLPFLMEVIYTGENTFYIEIINGEERIKIPEENIHFGRDKTRAMDSIRIDFPVFDTYITGSFQERFIKGKWVVNYRENYAIPFRAEFGRDYRFTELRKAPVMDLSGTWEATFGLDSEHPYKAVGEFEQNENNLSGTFLTQTGDYRFLEGTVQEDKLYLSTFDGSHAFLFEGKILPDSSIIGSFRSGSHYKTTWKAYANSTFALADPDSLTFLKPGYETFDFSFENTDGDTVSINDSRYQGKVKIVQILGTWCPNCRDETDFLTTYFENNKMKNVEIIALAFERYHDRQKAMDAIRRYKAAYGMDYEILLAGYADKEEAAAALPMLNQLLSYPTLIFIDKNNKVRKIHTGFSGPATSRYPEFIREFDEFVKKLAAE